MHFRSSVLLPLFAVLFPACVFAPSAPHPIVQNAPASEEDDEDSRASAVLRTAATDLACPKVGIIMAFRREWANNAQPRFVVQGCDQRAVYAEDCSEYPRCRYLVMSVMQLPVPSPRPEPAPEP
jgi:hypothetical protein